ncbi:hypothetical protein WMY93_006190 [Mugilogobius chulae]|uniref:Uncharacterized protein n=1 Tax=Mugilogobius chulae TaxID=88201 RepID=A0AAW0PJD4_9GOBI
MSKLFKRGFFQRIFQRLFKRAQHRKEEQKEAPETEQTQAKRVKKTTRANKESVKKVKDRQNNEQQQEDEPTTKQTQENPPHDQLNPGPEELNVQPRRPSEPEWPRPQPRQLYVREDLPPEPEDTPPEPEDMPPEPEDMPPETEDMPPEPEDMPSETEDMTTETEDMPPETEDTPPEPEDMPSETEDMTTETEDTPPETEDMTLGPEDMPPGPEELDHPPELPGPQPRLLFQPEMRFIRPMVPNQRPARPRHRPEQPRSPEIMYIRRQLDQVRPTLQWFEPNLLILPYNPPNYHPEERIEHYWIPLQPMNNEPWQPRRPPRPPRPRLWQPRPRLWQSSPQPRQPTPQFRQPNLQGVSAIILDRQPRPQSQPPNLLFCNSAIDRVRQRSPPSQPSPELRQPSPQGQPLETRNQQSDLRRIRRAKYLRQQRLQPSKSDLPRIRRAKDRMRQRPQPWQSDLRRIRRAKDRMRQRPQPWQPSPDLGQPSPDHRQPRPDLGQPSPDLRQPNPDPRQPSPDPRQPSPDLRQPSPDLRQPRPDLRLLKPQGCCSKPSLCMPGSPPRKPTLQPTQPTSKLDSMTPEHLRLDETDKLALPSESPKQQRPCQNDQNCFGPWPVGLESMQEAEQWRKQRAKRRKQRAERRKQRAKRQNMTTKIPQQRYKKLQRVGKLMRIMIRSLTKNLQKARRGLKTMMRSAHCAEDRAKVKNISRSLLGSLKATIKKQKTLKTEVRQKLENEEESDPKPSTSKQAFREEKMRNANNNNNNGTNSSPHSRRVERIRAKRKSVEKLKLMRWTIKSLVTIFQETKIDLEAAIRTAHCAEDRQKLKFILKSLVDSFKATRKEHKAFTTELRHKTTEEEERGQDSPSRTNDSQSADAGKDKIMGQTQKCSEQEKEQQIIQSTDVSTKSPEEQEQPRVENDSLLRKLKHESDRHVSLTKELGNVKKELEDMRTLCESLERKVCVKKLHKKMLEDSLKATRKELQDTKAELSKLEQKSTKEERGEEQSPAEMEDTLKKNTTQKENGASKLLLQEVEPQSQEMNSVRSKEGEMQPRPEEHLDDDQTRLSQHSRLLFLVFSAITNCSRRDPLFVDRVTDLTCLLVARGVGDPGSTPAQDGTDYVGHTRERKELQCGALSFMHHDPVHVAAAAVVTVEAAFAEFAILGCFWLCVLDRCPVRRPMTCD